MEPAFVKQVLVFLCGVSPVAPFHSLMRYSVESLRQCYGIVTGFIGETKPKKFKIILYDDGCHFAPFAKDSTRASYSTAATTVSELEYYIDEMHFKGHVSKVCHEKYNPYSCEALTKVNMQICEQTFNCFDKFTQ